MELGAAAARDRAVLRFALATQVPASNRNKSTGVQACSRLMENMRTHGSPSKPVSVVVVPRALVPLLLLIALLILLILLLGS